MIGEVVDLFLGFSPGVDIVNGPGEANGFSGLGIGGDGSFLNSHELPGIVAQAKFMIEYLASLQIPFIEQVPRGDEQTDEIGYCTAFVSNRRKAGNGYVSQI